MVGGTISGPLLPCPLQHPPVQTMYEQVRHFLTNPLGSAKRAPEIPAQCCRCSLATIALCLRRGTYVAGLADQAKPLRAQTAQTLPLIPLRPDGQTRSEGVPGNDVSQAGLFAAAFFAFLSRTV